MTYDERPFREAYSDLFHCLPEHKKEFDSKIGFFNMLGNHAFCGVHSIDGRIVWVSGWYEVAPGVCEGFIYPSIYIFQYQKTFFKEVKRWLAYLNNRYRRVQCFGEDTELSRRWLSHLGFELEAVLKEYTTDGSSFLIWRLK